MLRRKLLTRRRLAPSWSLTPANAAAKIAAGQMIFSRGTLATQVNADGSIGWAPHNLARQSDAIASSPWATANASVAGSKLIESATNATHQLYQVGLGTFAGRWSVRVRAKPAGRTQLRMEQDSGGNALFTLTGAGSVTPSGTNSPTIEFDGTYYYCTNVFTAANAWSLYLTLVNGGVNSYVGDGVSGIEIDQVQVNAGPLQPYYPTTSAAYHGLRTADYSDGTVPGIKIEPQATNLLANSTSLSGSGWSAVAATVTPSSATGPDDLQSATLVSCPGSNGIYGWIATLAASTSYTLSVYLKKLSADVRIGLESSGFPAGTFATINAATGSVVSSSGVSVSVKPSKNGFWRISLTATSIASPTNGANLTVYAVTAGDFLTYGAQAEVGTVATSYIPTAGSAVTRGADVLSVPVAAVSGWQATQGTVITDSVRQGAVYPGDYRGEWSFNGGSGAQTIQMFSNNTTLFGELTVGGADVAYPAVGTVVSAGARRKRGLSYSQTSVRLESGAGGVGASVVPSNFPSGITQLNVGSINAFPTFNLNGSIYKLDYYPMALPAAILQRLTA